MFTLTIPERLAIIACSASLLCIVIFITLCCVCPYCWIYKRIQYRAPETSSCRKKKYATSSNNDLKPTYNDVEQACSHSLTYNDPPPSYENTIFHHPMELVHLNSICSNSSDTGIPLPQLNEMDTEFVDFSETTNQICGTITFMLKYRQKEDSNGAGLLQIIPKEANDLPIRPYGYRCDVFLVLQVNKLPKRKHHIGKAQTEFTLCQFETAIRRRCQNPMFDETFTVHMNEKDITKCILKIIVWDKEKFVNDSALGEVHVNLKEVFDAKKPPSEEYNLKLNLKEPKLSYGEILLGLCYLPTAERMTVAVLKINNLKQDTHKEETDIVAFVQAMAVYSGKIIEKRKTSSRPYTLFPVFNEMLMFDVPASKLESIVLMVSVRIKLSTQHITDHHGNVQKKEETCIGKVLIGSNCKKNELQHWNAMKNSPRKQVVQWHVLR